MTCNDHVIDLEELTKAFALLKNTYFVEHEDRIQMESLIQNYREEVRISRECESSERLRATSCQQYVAHEQEIVRQLIAVKGENAKLMQSIANLEGNQVILKQDLVAEQRKHEQELMKVQEQNKVEMICISKKHAMEMKENQTNWDKQEAEWNANRAELLANIEALQKKLDASNETANIAASLFEEKIGNLEAENGNLRKELREMQENAVLKRDRANANISMWKKKSLEQQDRLQKLERPAPIRKPPPPPIPPSILKRAKSVSFNRNAILSSPNDFLGNNAGGSEELCNRVCTPAPFPWDARLPPADTCAPTAPESTPVETFSNQTPKKRRLFSNNNAIDEDLYECN